MRLIYALSTALLISGSITARAQDAAEVDAIVAAVKAKNGDIRALCQSGPDGIRKAATEAVTELARAGKTKGNPGQVGGAASQKIGIECRG